MLFIDRRKPAKLSYSKLTKLHVNMHVIGVCVPADRP